MLDYKLYVMKPDGHISQAIDLNCRDDDHARQAANEQRLAVRSELWQAARLVSIIDIHQD